MTAPYEEEEERKEASSVGKGAGGRGPKLILRPSALRSHRDDHFSLDNLAGTTKKPRLWTENRCPDVDKYSVGNVLTGAGVQVGRIEYEWRKDAELGSSGDER